MKTETVNNLKDRLKELYSEIELIEKLIGIWESNSLNTKENISTKMIRTKISPKGDRNWLDYICYAMSFLRDKPVKQLEVKAQEIAELMKEANPDIKPERIIDAVRNNLLRLIEQNRVIRIKADSKIEGYTYKLNEDYAK